MNAGEAGPVCKSCGEELPSKARFCPSCGVRLAEHHALSQEFAGEHRQITVMFCDLVGSTELAAQLHPEDLRVLLREYQLICAEAIERYDGMISHYLGDGVIANFGYPRAREDAAIRGVDAALQITSRLEALEKTYLEGKTVAPAARISLHTGRVLVGEMGRGDTREQHALTGIVPNIAARLEQHAPRNGVVVSPQTRSLVGGSFQLRSLGVKSLKGVPDPLEVFEVAGRVNATSVLRPREDAPIGREDELAALDAAWARARDGVSRVTVAAEPGAGKTTLAGAFLARADLTREQIVELACTETGRNTPYSSLSAAIDRWLRASASRDPQGDPRSRLRAWFDGDPANAAQHAAAFEAVWSPDPAAEPPSPRAVADAASAFAASRPSPLLIIVEDAHWIDASTLEILDHVLDREGARVMLLALTRPGAQAQWDRDQEVRIELQSLDAIKSGQLIEATLGAPAEPAVVQRIFAATEGLPLYLEEYTRSLRDSEAIALQRGVFRTARLDTEQRTPDSLLDLITARLDTLGDAKLLAQICSVLGPSAARTALIEVSNLPTEQVDIGIAALSLAGVLSVARGGALSFRHALFQTASYESLVREARRTWHSQYLAYLESNPERVGRTRPEILGHHLEGAERHREALDAYLRAGLAANRASASREAAAHFQKCLDLTSAVPRSEADETFELRLQVHFAGALLSALGPGSAKTRGAYDAALALAEATPESEWQLPAYWGWWRVSDNFATMAQRAHKLLTVSERMKGQEFRLQAQHCVWANSFQQGDLTTSIESATEGLAIYDSAAPEDLGTLYGGHDCKVCALGEIALARWLQGAGDAAVAEVEASLAHAEALGHVGSIMHALDIAVMLHHYRGDHETVALTAKRLDRLGAENDLEEYRAKAEIYLGWSMIPRGPTQEALTRIETGFDVLQDIGTPEDFPVYQCMRAEALKKLGDLDAATSALNDGRAIIAAEGVNYWGSELARWEAEIGAAGDHPDYTAIGECLDDAAAITRKQGALMLELRTALTRAALADELGEIETAPETLAAIVDRFDPAARAREIEAARRLLKTWSVS